MEQKSIATLETELFKEDAVALNRLAMYRKLSELYGADLAEEYLRQLEEHEIYRHDETAVVGKPYCASVTLYPFLLHGNTSIGGTSDAPKNLASFTGAFINLVFALASQFCGAVSTPEWLSYMDYFIRKEYGDDYYLHTDKAIDLSNRERTIDKVITDAFEQVVYSLNQPAAARGNQSVFWNIAYFDHPYFEGMFENFVFPDGTAMQWASVNWLQKRFMRWFNEERRRKLLTFPVETVNLLDDGHDYVDSEWKDFVAEMWSKLYVPRDCYNSYFFVVEDPTLNVLDKLRFHGKAFTRYLDGGSACHINLDEHLTKEQYLLLLNASIRTGCNYLTFNVPNTLCNSCGYISKHRLDACPKCGSSDLDYATRIIGYLKLISRFARDRQIEAGKRHYSHGLEERHESEAES